MSPEFGSKNSLFIQHVFYELNIDFIPASCKRKYQEFAYKFFAGKEHVETRSVAGEKAFFFRKTD